MKGKFGLLALGLQFAILACSSSVIALLVVRAAGVSPQIEADVISTTFLAQGLFTVLMGTRWRFIGPAQPLFIAPAVTYLVGSLRAVSIGGLPLVFGMTLFSGLLQLLFTPLLRLSQHLISTQIGSVLLLVIGFETVYFGLKGLSDVSAAGEYLQIALALGTILFIYILKIWDWRPVSRLSVLWAVVFGYVAAYCLGLLHEGAGAALADAPWIRMPRFLPGGISFRWSLVVPFTVAAVISSVRIIGTIAAMQKMEQPDQLEPDMENIGRGNATDALCTVASGALGGVGIAVSAATTAVALESKLSDRRFAWVAGAFVILIGLISKASTLILYIPPAVLNGVLIYLGISIIQSHIPAIAHAMERRRSALYLAVALLLGIGQPVFPLLLGQLPKELQLFTGSGAAVACIVAIILRVLARVRLRDDQLGK